MNVGIVFAVVFDLCFLLGMRLLRPSYVGGWTMSANGMAEPIMPGLGLTGYLKLALLGLVLIASAIGGYAVVRSIFKGKGGIQGDIFLAGASLLPWAMALLVIGVLGLGNMGIFPVPLIFGLTTMVLMTYSGCTGLQGAPEAAATLAVPLMLLVDLYACEIFMRMFF